MRREEILDTLLRLAKVQPFYTRIVEAWVREGMLEAVLDELVEKNFQDDFDMVLYFER